MSKLILRLPHNFPQTSRPQWDVRFTVNRLLFRRMHDSVSKAGPHGRILFPSAVHPSGFRAGPQASLSLDRRIASNPRQSLAVKQIVSKSPGGVPFIIFGPPGTGKTTVLVESIRQVVDTQPNSRVLVCAPSNTATDLIATRLLDRYTPRQLVRLNAPARAYSGLPAALRNYSPAEGKTFNAPPADKLKEFRIVVTTCYYSSIPPALGVNEHFTHIFVDEAGHAAEPEIMIPILQNASRSTNIIISGDPMQLGPIVQSKTCIHFNMDVSFLERLAELSLYQIPAGEASNPHIVKLLQNYRSHPAILNYSNHVFYDNELEYRADPALTGSLLRFPELPTEGFPIIFHNICGENLREAKSPSFFNIEEATVVNHYVSKLLDDRRFRLEPSQIGVITPYRQQCSKIKKLLQAGRHGGVDVRVTEDWQGQERRVIIISAVRSDPELLEEGAAQFLGFVSSWRRTNVALTRAQALLIVIGNAPILELDPIWYFFMRFVHDSGGWAGPGDIADFILNPADQIFEKLGGVNKNYESFIAARREKLNWAAKAESLQT
ncbi:P-loop containing nucleoside triphosphate hydrolase protein [Ceratobasidium sp. AG-I]|nr:P-loop containing nucleoside triphosphate hydrolase protein [Ceratobasidium sp. AG-I]